MGESTCLVHAFAYASGTPNEAKEGNPIHALGESISFGRFMSESLSWEKWSSFSNNRYVEEAEKYSKPGSVAQKKAFFEAHYKRIAAQKAAAAAEAAAAAALLEQEKHKLQPVSENTVHNTTSNYDLEKSQENVDERQDVETPNMNTYKSTIEVDKLNLCEVERDGHSAKLEPSCEFETEIGEKSEMEKPLLKEALGLTNKKKPALRATKFPSSPGKYKATIVNNAKKENNATPLSKIAAIDYSNNKRFTPKPIPPSVHSSPAREIKKAAFPDIGSDRRSRIVASFGKAYNCLTPTPSKGFTPKHSSRTPQSENRRAQTPVHPSASGSKTIGPKWRFLAMDFSKPLSACRNKPQSPIISSPFNLRTEERAAKRKEKLEEKFNEKVVQKVQLQTKVKEKAESELKKLRQSLCFKARPLPEFYKERKPPNNTIHMMPWPQSDSPNPGRKPSPSRAHDSLSSLKPAIQRSNGKQDLPKKNGQKFQNHIRHTSLAEMIRHENMSPNILF